MVTTASSASLTLVRVGEWFSAVEIEPLLGRAVAAWLAEEVAGAVGPVLAGPGCVHFLLPPGATDGWHVLDTRPVPAGEALALPGPSHTASHGGLLAWLSPPDGRRLVDPVALRTAVRAAHGGYTARHEALLEARIRALPIRRPKETITPSV